VLHAQNSAQRPVNVPARSARNWIVAVRPGIRSFLPCRFGTQKLWITSSDSSVTTTGLPIGT
jgi:hypothetical protein